MQIVESRTERAELLQRNLLLTKLLQILCIPINGYTLYVEEPVAQLSGTDLEGRTMFMTPTSTKALLLTKSASIPKRRSEGHKIIIDGKKRIVNNILTDTNGGAAEVNYIEAKGLPYASGASHFLYVMSSDTDVLTKYAMHSFQQMKREKRYA